MALTKDQILQLQSSAKARKLFALEFSKAFAAIHRAFPKRSDYATDAEYNEVAQAYNAEIKVATKLEQAINEQGILSIYGCNMLLAALSTYGGLTFSGETESGLIDKVLGYEEQGANIMQLECTKLLKGWTFSAKII